MERIYPPQHSRANHHYSRVKDLEHSQQWTSLASDINDLERAKMRRKNVAADPRKLHILHRRSMPEPQHTSSIYVDVNSEYDYGTGSNSLTNKSMKDHYFLPIGSESIDESAVDSWSWRTEGDHLVDKQYFVNNNYENYVYNRPAEYWEVDNRPAIDRENENRRNTYSENLQRLMARDKLDGEISGEKNHEKNVINKEKPFYNNSDGRLDTEETAYRGSRERLREIFRRNRDLRKEFFASIPKSTSDVTKSAIDGTREFKDRVNRRGVITQETGSGYGSSETLTSQSNNSEISVIQNRGTRNSSRASQNSKGSEVLENGGKVMQDIILVDNTNWKYTTLGPNGTKNSNRFGESVSDKEEGDYYTSYKTLMKTESCEKISDPPKSLESPGFFDCQSPPPPLPSSEPPSSIFGHQVVISGDSMAGSEHPSITASPPDPPERQSSGIKKLEAPAILTRDNPSSQADHRPELEGLRMLNRFEACIENRKLSPLLMTQINKPEDSNMPDDFGRWKKNYKSMPDLANADVIGNSRNGAISRLSINGSTIDLDFADRDYSRGKFNRGLSIEDKSEFENSETEHSGKSYVTEIRPTLKYAEEPEEIHATKILLQCEKSKLSNRRQRIPPPLDLTKVSEALREETLRHDRRVLRDYTVENASLEGELLKCKVKLLDGTMNRFNVTDENFVRPRVNVALKTATNLLGLSRNSLSSRPVIPVRGRSGSEKNFLKRDETNGNLQSTKGSPSFSSSVVVWCDGDSKEHSNAVPQTILTRISRLDHRKSTGSLLPTTGNTFPSVYAPIPYKSPRRYVEGEVTIHYRSPVRTETKEVLSEAELARRSAENMRRVYQEERRRKYLQELHDIDSRRHTDNFTPSQKSPIPLNRYDDFVDDLSQRSRSQEQTPEPRLVAKALYNFVGQSSRELTFRRGDIIFVRRQVDKNWYEGEHNAMIGLFPFNYVEILPYDGIRTTTMPKKPYEGQARAKFNFVAQTTHELSLVKGDLVVLTRRVDENWYEGRIGSKKGIFPISYVEVLVEPGIRSEAPAQNKPVAAPAAHSLLSNGSAGGKLSMGPHHYTPSIPTNTNATQANYNSLPRMGGSKLHVAPVNETLHIDTHSEPLRYRALYNYRPQNDDELELKEGDAVYVMEKCDDGWFVGSSQRTGCFGTFPGNYVDRM